MYYDYLGAGSGAGTAKYRITIEIYRDCNGGGADFDNPAVVTVYKEHDGQVSFVRSDYRSIKTRESVPIIPMPCMTVPNVCVERAKYSFDLELPVGDFSYHIVYQRCCRNETITNIVTPGEVGATYSVEITSEAMAAKSSSPRFTELPPSVICNQLPLSYDHSAEDPDADQLVYSFCSPLKGGGPLDQGTDVTSCDGVAPDPACPPPFQLVTFVQPTYSPTNPMGGSPQITINPVTGLIKGTPQQLGQYVVSVCVKEYRNGVLLSTVRREFQFNVADCQPDVLADIEKDSVLDFRYFLFRSCGDQTIAFKNKSLGGSDIKSYQWTFDLNNGNVATSTERDPVITFPDTGTYEGTMVLNKGLPCDDSLRIRVQVFPPVYAAFTYDYDTCVAGPVSFTDASSGEGIVTNWSWDFGDGGSDKSANPLYEYTDPGIFPVSLRVRDGNGCEDDTTQVITYQPAPRDVIIAPSTYHGCIPARIFFNNLSTPIDSTYTFEWDFGDGTGDSVQSPIHVFDQEGLYSVGIKITSPIGCEASNYFPNWIQVKPSPKADFSYEPKEIIGPDVPIRFQDLSSDAVRWYWNFDSLATTQLQNPVYAFQDTGRHIVYLRVVHPNGCVDTTQRLIDVIPDVRLYMPNAFTPNQDTRNDIFIGKGHLDGVKNYRFVIWNRWGEKVFETTDTALGWDGRIRGSGRPAPPGVYVYVVSYTEPRGKPVVRRGFATLIR